MENNMNTKSDWIKYGAGMVHLKKGNKYKAEELFNSLIADHPSYAYPYEQIGYLRKNEGKTDQASEWFRKAIHRMPETEMGYYRRGLSLTELKKFDAASDSFSKVIEMNPNHNDAILNLAIILGKKGDFNKAKQIINDLYLANQEQQDGYARLGWIKTETKNWQGALALMDKDRKLDRLSAFWKINFAIVYGWMDDFPKAVEVIENVYKLDHYIKDGFSKLGWIKVDAKDWSGALELMKRDLKEKRITPAWKFILAQLFGRSGEWDMASGLLEDAYSADTNLKDGYARLGWIKTEAQDWIGAYEFMAKDRDKGRISNDWKNIMLVMQVFLGDEIGAINTVHEWYSNDHKAVDGYGIIGWAHYLSTRNEEKLQSFLEKDSELNRCSAIGLRTSAWALSIHGNSVAAYRALDAIYSKNPAIRDGFAVMGWLRIEKAEFKEGLELMEKDYRLQRLTPTWQINYAYQLAKMGQLRKARALFSEVVESPLDHHEFRIGFQVLPLEIMTKTHFQKMIGIEV
jgi:tetratricopeptide (TPR) repeat protein